MAAVDAVFWAASVLLSTKEEEEEEEGVKKAVLNFGKMDPASTSL